MRRAVLVLAAAGVGVAILSELLVGSIGTPRRRVGRSQFHRRGGGAIVGNAAEHWVGCSWRSRTRGLA